MAKTFPALINSEILRWVRSFMRFDLDYVSEKAGVKPERLKEWEGGHSRPTISQLRRLAKVYKARERAPQR